MGFPSHCRHDEAETLFLENRHSKRAKELLDDLGLYPSAQIVEVDLRREFVCFEPHLLRRR